MAAKRKKKKGRLKALVIFILTPPIVWGLAFITWLYWDPITRLLNRGEGQSKTRPQAARSIKKSERSNALGEKRGEEQILDDERKKLDEILRKQGSHN